jgi:ribonuclease HII
MGLWAGVDEAGYGPRLGPLVVAGAAFSVPHTPRPGVVWDLLADAVCRSRAGSDGRLVVNDSKQVYTPAMGLRQLEEGVLAALLVAAPEGVRTVGQVVSQLACRPAYSEPPGEPFAEAHEMRVPLATNASALASKSDLLRRAAERAGVQFHGVRASAAFPPEYNRVVELTRNKSLLLFQKCGLVLQNLWAMAGPGVSRIVVDRHGGRIHYRRLLGDVFPGCRCDVLAEERAASSYRIRNRDRTLLLTFLQDADQQALPVSLASMFAKYVREAYMLAFNRYWQARVPRLKSTAGYGRDARRFLRDIGPALAASGMTPSLIVRRS